MGSATITTRRFDCDHCGDYQAFDNDAEAGKAGWALLNVNGKEYALCRIHYNELKVFLHVGNMKPFPVKAGV